MKKFLLKALDILLTIIMVASVLYSIFNLVMSFLPVNVQTMVYGWLNMSTEYIATFSISAAINAAVLVGTKIAQTYTRIKLTSQLIRSEEINANTVKADETIVERTNAAINNLRILQDQLNALLTVQKVTTERNIKASEKLVYKSDKEAYKRALEQIEKVQQEFKEINNIATVYEKTEIKEIVVNKEEDPNVGRV